MKKLFAVLVAILFATAAYAQTYNPATQAWVINNFCKLTGCTPTISSVTFANLPVAGTAGKMAFVSNVGTKGSLWVDDGTRWKPLNGAALLASLDATSAGVNASETIKFQYQIPAGMWQVGDIVRLYVNIQKSGTTNTGQLNVRIGTNGTTGDGAVYSVTALAAGNRMGSYIHDIRLESATSVLAVTLPSTGYGASVTTTPPAAFTIPNISTATWISVAITGGASDTVSITSAQLWYLSKAN